MAKIIQFDPKSKKSDNVSLPPRAPFPPNRMISENSNLPIAVILLMTFAAVVISFGAMFFRG